MDVVRWRTDRLSQLDLSTAGCLSFPVLSDADLSTIETHFRNNWGRYGTFTFRDPESGTDYTKCRYDQDVLEIVHSQPNVNSLTLRVMETN